MVETDGQTELTDDRPGLSDTTDDGFAQRVAVLAGRGTERLVERIVDVIEDDSLRLLDKITDDGGAQGTGLLRGLSELRVRTASLPRNAGRLAAGSVYLAIRIGEFAFRAVGEARREGRRLMDSEITPVESDL